MLLLEYSSSTLYIDPHTFMKNDFRNFKKYLSFFPDNLGLLADRLIGIFDIEAVVEPIGVKISDAIMNFQNSGYEVTGKVFEDCGRPRLQKRQVRNSTQCSKIGKKVQFQKYKNTFFCNFKNGKKSIFAPEKSLKLHFW